jgi:hypothetical protein
VTPRSMTRAPLVRAARAARRKAKHRHEEAREQHAAADATAWQRADRYTRWMDDAVDAADDDAARAARPPAPTGEPERATWDLA